MKRLMLQYDTIINLICKLKPVTKNNYLKYNGLFYHFKGAIMARVCQVTGKKSIFGNNVSHAHNKTRRRFYPNLHSHRIWVESENRFVKIKTTARGLKTIDKKGIDTVLVEMRARGEKI